MWIWIGWGAAGPGRVQSALLVVTPPSVLPQHHSQLIMPPIAPPIDAELFLNSQQKSDLERIPAPFRPVGAWLILLRDDRRGEWDQRRPKCVECTGQQIPCLDRVNPSAKRSRCEGCCLGDMRCAPGYEPPAQNDAPLIPMEFAQTGKRTYDEEGYSSTTRKILKLAEGSVAATASSESSVPPAYTSSNESTPFAAVRDTLPSSLGGSPSKAESDRTTLVTETDGKNEKMAKATTSLERVQVMSSSTSYPQYPFGRVRWLIGQVRKNVHISHLLIRIDLRDGEFDNRMWNDHDFTVAVTSPKRARASTWLVSVVDHKNRLARVMFNANGQTKTGSSGDGEGELFVRSALRTAFDAFMGRVTVEGINCPRLVEGAAGNFYATSLAIACVRSLPEIPVHDFIIEDAKALQEHAALLDDAPNPPSAASLGAISQVVARISRHDGRFQMA